MRSRHVAAAALMLACIAAGGLTAYAQDVYVGPSNAYAQSLADKLLRNQQVQRPVVRRLGQLVGTKLQDSRKITSVIISTKCDHYTTMDASFDDGTTQSVVYTEKIQSGDIDALREVSVLIHVVSESCEAQ